MIGEMIGPKWSPADEKTLPRKWSTWKWSLGSKIEFSRGQNDRSFWWEVTVASKFSFLRLQERAYDIHQTIKILCVRGSECFRGTRACFYDLQKQIKSRARAVRDVLRIQERAPAIRKTIKISRARFWMFCGYRRVLLLLGKWSVCNNIVYAAPGVFYKCRKSIYNFCSNLECKWPAAGEEIFTISTFWIRRKQRFFVRFT